MWRTSCSCPHGTLAYDNQGWISRNTSRKDANFTLHTCFLVPSPLSQEAASPYVRTLSSLILFLPSLLSPPKTSFPASNQPSQPKAFSCFLSRVVPRFEGVLWKYHQICLLVLQFFCTKRKKSFANKSVCSANFSPGPSLLAALMLSVAHNNYTSKQFFN